MLTFSRTLGQRIPLTEQAASLALPQGAVRGPPCAARPPARRLTGAAPRTQDGGARVPGLGGPLGQRAVAAEEAAPARPPHPATGAGRPGGEPQGDGGR